MRHGRRLDIEDPVHEREPEERKSRSARQRLLMRFLELGPAAGPYHRELDARAFRSPGSTKTTVFR